MNHKLEAKMKKRVLYIIAVLLIIGSIGIYHFAANSRPPHIYRVFQDSEKDFTIFENVAISNDGSLTAAGSEQSKSDSWVRIWSTHTGKLLRTLHGREVTSADASNPIAFAFAPNNKQMAIAQNEIKVWDISSGKLLQSVKLPAGTGWIVKFSTMAKHSLAQRKKTSSFGIGSITKKPLLFMQKIHGSMI